MNLNEQQRKRLDEEERYVRAETPPLQSPPSEPQTAKKCDEEPVRQSDDDDVSRLIHESY